MIYYIIGTFIILSILPLMILIGGETFSNKRPNSRFAKWWKSNIIDRDNTE
jgi:hypothetical protein